MRVSRESWFQHAAGIAIVVSLVRTFAPVVHAQALGWEARAFATFVFTAPARAPSPSAPRPPGSRIIAVRAGPCHALRLALLSNVMNLRPTTGRFSDCYWYPQRPGGVVRFSDHP